MGEVNGNGSASLPLCRGSFLARGPLRSKQPQASAVRGKPASPSPGCLPSLSSYELCMSEMNVSLHFGLLNSIKTP